MTNEQDDNAKHEEAEVSENQETQGSEAESNDSSIVDEYSRGDRRLADGSDPAFKWYVAHVLTGHENKVKRALIDRIFNFSSEELFSDIYIPEEAVVSNVKGKKRTLKKKFFPGYILIKMIMNDKTWHLVRDTDKITGFIGANKNRPAPLSDEEAQFLTNQAKEGYSGMKVNTSFSEGDSVRVIEGPFTSFIGTVETVTDKGKVRVQVSIFGRPTPVELDFTQIEKV